jgi:hypothetical protein
LVSGPGTGQAKVSRPTSEGLWRFYRRNGERRGPRRVGEAGSADLQNSQGCLAGGYLCPAKSGERKATEPPAEPRLSPPQSGRERLPVGTLRRWKRRWARNWRVEQGKSLSLTPKPLRYCGRTISHRLAGGPLSLNGHFTLIVFKEKKATAGNKGGSRLFFGFHANRDFRGRRAGFGRAV